METNMPHYFNPCLRVLSLRSLHSLSFRLFRKRCPLTIFKVFNFMACEKSVERREVKFSRVFERLINYCVLDCCEYIEDCLKKDGVFTVGKRRLFPEKRRVRGAKTSFFETKDFVFFRKNGVFSALVAFPLCGRRCFARKSPQNMENFSSNYLFCFLALSLGKCWNTVLDFVNCEEMTISNFRPIVITPEELASMAVSHNGRAVERREPQQSAKDAGGGLFASPLSEQEAYDLVTDMELNAELAPELELTAENWDKEFGEDGMVDTPIGKVKMGENQFLKLLKKKRNSYFGMIKPTLVNPDMVLEENDPQDGAERDTKYLFVKTFVKPDGSRYVHFESVTVQKGNLEVSISSHEIGVNALMKKVHQDKLIHLNEKFFNSDGRLIEPQKEGSDLVPTPTSSEDKDTTISQNGNGSNEEIAQTEQHSAVSMLPHDIDGNPIYEQGEPAVAFDAITEQCEGNGEVAMSVAESMLADKVKALKAVEKAKSKGGETVAEKIAAEKERMAAIEQAKKDVEAWQAIVEAGKQKQAAQAMGSRQAAVAPEVVADGTLNGVPDVIDDTPQEARARGYRRVNGHKVERQEPVAHSTGREVEVKFSNDKTVKGHAVLIEADELQPSHQGGQRNPVHFIDEAQPKERVDNASRAALNRMAAHIRPEEITSSVTAYTGAPTVNARGEVIQGNNRSGALKAMYAQRKDQAEKYKQYLLDNAERLGLDRAEIEAMKNPVLVNMVDVSDEEAVNLGQYEAKDTESGGVERIKPKNTVQKIGTDIGAFFNTLFASNEEDLSLAELIDKNGAEVLAYLNRKGYITDTQYKSAFDSKGNLTAEAKNDLRGIVVSHIFQNGNSRLEEMFNAMPAKAQKAILATAYRDNASPESERMMTEIQNSVRAFNALMQYDEFANARNYEAARKAVENWAKQYQYDDATGESYLPAEKFSNFALVLAAMYKGRTQKFVQDSFTDMYDLIQGTRKGDLFGTPDNTPRTLAQAIKEVLNIDYNENRNGQAGNYGVGIDTQKSERGRRGSNGDVGGRKHSKGTEPQTDSGGRTGRDSQGNGRRGNIGKHASRQSDLAETEEVKLSDEIDENGRQFVLTPNGDLVFGVIDESSGLTVAPILLSEGMITNPATNDGYGLVHIEARHGDQIRKAGYKSVVEFIETVAKHYDVIKEGNIRDGRQTYRLQLKDKHNNTLMIELSGDGTYWNINTAGIFKTSYGKENKEVYSRHTTAKQSVETVETSQGAEQGDTQTSSSMSVSTTSDDKGTTKNETDNEPNEKFRLRTSERQEQTERYGYTEDDYKAEDALNKKYAKELSYLDSIYDDDLEFDRNAVELEDRLPDGFTIVVRNNRCVIILHEPAVYTNLKSTRRRFKVGDTIQISYEGRYPHVTVTKVDSNGKVVSAIDAFDGRTIIENGKRRNIDDVLNEPAPQTGNGDELGEKIAQAEAEVDTDPTEKQKEAGNYKKGHVRIGKFDISIEQPKGSVRRGVDANGRTWETKMNNTYGYIRGTESVDGDHIDVFLSDDIDNWDGQKVFVVDQYNEDGSFDEHKVMLGFNDINEAYKAYLSNYENGWADKHTLRITQASLEEFEKWIDSSNRKTKEFSEYKKVKKETVANNPATYTIEPAQYTTKRGKVLDMHLVKFADTLSKEQFRAAKELAKAERGWYDAKQGGFMMRSEESARQLAETVVGNKEAVADAQPVSLADINKVTEQQPQAGETEEDDISSQAERIAAEVERERLAKQEKKAVEESSEKGRAEQTTSVNGATPTFGRYQKAYDDFIDGIENKGMLPDIKALKNKIAQAKRRLTTLDKGAALGIKNDDDLQRHEAAMEDATQMRDAYQAMLDYVNKRVRDNEKKPKSNPSGNKLVTDERYAELRERLRKKLNNLNVGIDPEILSIGIEMAVYHLEKGSRKFADYATAMIADLGDVVRPYLKAFYNGARDLPEVESSDFATDLTPYNEVQEFDIATFGKEHNEPMTTAEVVVAEQAHQEEAEQAKQEIISQRNSERKANEGYNGFKRGDKVLFTPQGRNKKTVEATIFDFEDYGDHNPILDTGLAPILYETVEWNDIKPIESEKTIEKEQSRKKSLPLQQTGELSLFDGSIKNNENGLQRDDAALRSERLSADSDRNAGAGSRTGNLQEVREDTGRVDRRGENGNGRAGSGETQSDGVFVRPLQQLEGKNSRNNHSERGKDHAPTSVDARIEANFKAVELAKQLLESGEEATEEQKEVLRKFSGWGGLGKVFDEHANYSHDGRSYYNEPTSENKRLRELLSEEEYQQALMSANSAYYTPAYVIDTLWDIAEQMGFKGGNILEGSAGIGNILGQMPASISANSDIQAVEIDGISGAILSLLYPDAKVEIQGFEQTRVPNGSVDLAVTNVPFVTGLRVNDTTGDNDLSKKFHNIHDFCIAKNVRKLREGGLGIFITSSGTLDNSRKLRDWVVNEGEADFVGAFRMNNKTFGGTGVTSDIIVIRKRVNGQKSAQAIDVSTVTGERVAEYDTGEKRKVKGQYEPVVKNLSMDYNKYFMEHPERMAGEMRFGFEEGDRYRPTSKGLYPKQGTNQKELLSEFVKSFTQEEVGERSTEEKKNDEVVPDKKVGEMFVKDGKLYINSISNARLLDVNSNKVKGHTKAECFEAYSAIKKALADVLAYQTENESDDGLKPLLDKLNKAYDDFVETYGHFNKNTAIAFLRNDVDYANVSSVETYKEQGDGKGGVNKLFGKADVMDKRVVEKVKEPNPTNVKEGIVASVFKFGHVDVPYIAERLGRSIDDVKNEIIENGYGFEDPVTRKVEASYQYLSGNVREKLSQAEANNENGEFDRNIKALQEKIPMDIPAHLIDFTLGSSWIDPELYDEYVKERTDVDARFTLVGGTWFMKEPSSTDYEKNRAMGVKSEVLNSTTMGHELIEAAIQNKTITVSTTRKNWDGKSETITDKDATQACANKIDEIRQDFKDWAKQKMQSDPDMSAKMERVYNDTFNNFVPISIPDEFAPEHFAGANPRYTMRPHQSRAIVRGTQQSVLLAHEVGTGKTFTLISTAMEMRRLGTARKPMIVVQNATVGQFVADAKELYPNAKILTLEDNDRNAEGRKNFYAKIRYNDWDMIVVPQSVFERIPDSENRQYQYIKEKIDEKVTSILQMKEQDPYGDSLIVEQAEREVERLEEELAELSSVVVKKNTAAEEKKRAVAKQNAEVRAMEMLDRRTDDVENFDDMGIDALLVDEAHEYKHLGFATAMQRGVKGVDPSYSKKSQGVFLKAQAVMEKNNGRNVVFATGTPISNTAAEIWTFMRYLMPADTMKEYGIYYFDDFVRNFGNIQQMLEFTTSGKFKENNRFAGYVNLPELVRIWSSVSDTVLTEEAPEVMEKIPELEGGKAQDIYLPQTRALRSVMKFVKSELERFDNMSGKEKKANSHIPVTMYGIAKAAAVDARLVQADAEDDPNSKTNEAVRQTLRSLKETADYNGTVAIFADNYQNKASGFNLYEDIRAKLIAEGVPADEIVVIKSGMTVKKKAAIFDKFNHGEVRVLLGSTFTLGTGVNIQERLHTLIHLDAPNRPMDYTQRNGRILRQGNIHKEMGKPVRVLRFGVEDSLDVTAYQRLKTKGAIADSIMRGRQMMENSMVNRVLEEEEDVFGDTIAQLSGSEYAMLKNNAEKNMRKYASRKKQYEADQTYIHNAKPKLKGLIKEAEQRIEDNGSYLKAVQSAFPNGRFGEISVGKQRFASVEAMEDFFKDYNKKALADMQKIKSGEITGDQRRELTIRIGDFDFVVTTDLSRKTASEGRTLFTQAERKMTYSCPELGIENTPVKQNLLRNAVEDITTNVLTGKDFSEQLEAAQRSKRHNEAELEQMLSREGKPFEYEKELKQAQAQYEEYSELMKKELEEKEAKYADMDASVETANGITSTEEDEEENDGDTLYRSDEDYTIETVNEKFNEELQQQIDGTLPQGHIYQIGMPGFILQSAGFPHLPIELSSTRLSKKASQENHIFDISEVKDLVKELNNPLAVFRYGDNAKNVIIGIEHNGKQFLVGVHFNQERNGLDISSIRGVFPKTNAKWLNWIVQGKAEYLNKEKIQTLIDQQRTNLADVDYLDLDSVAKIVKDFENPTNTDDIRFRLSRKGNLTDYELDSLYDSIDNKLTTLSEMDTSDIYTLVRMLAELNANATKGFADDRDMTNHERYWNKRIYSLKDKALELIAEELINRNEKIGYTPKGGIVYFIDKNGVQISFHRFYPSYSFPMDKLDTTVQWDGITESWRTEDDKRLTEERADIANQINNLARKHEEERREEVEKAKLKLEKEFGKHRVSNSPFSNPKAIVKRTKFSVYDRLRELYDELDASRKKDYKIVSKIIHQINDEISRLDKLYYQRIDELVENGDARRKNEIELLKQELDKFPKYTFVEAVPFIEAKSVESDLGIKFRKEENSNRNGVGAYTDDEISYENDPWSKLAGRPLRTQFQRKEFARKERQRMVDRVKKLAGKLHLGNVEIVTDADALEGKKKRAKGFYSKSTGKITIVIPNHTSTFDAEQTLLHEAVAHYGLRQLFGEHFDTFLDNVFTNADMQVREQIVALATRNGWDFRKATEEYLATLAENTNFENLNAGWWSKIKQLFMDLLHKIGFDGFGGVALSDNELRYILWRSYQNLVSPGKYKSILGEAEDIAKQYDLKVGDYAETKELSDKAAEKEDELMFRDIDPDNEFVVKDRAYAAHIYNQRVKGGMYQFKEAMQDSMLGLKELMRSVYEANGKKDFNIADVPTFENAYTGENALSSINEKEVEAFNRTFFQPLNVVISKLATTADERDELIEYMMAKHGLERNVYMAERDAKSKLEKSGKSEEELEKMIEKNRQRDYAGLTALTGIEDVAEAELEAERMVAEYESMHETEPIWDLLKEINDAILSKSLECGLISKETYETISSMYNYYIPLRGFDEKTADEEYAYLNERHGTFNAPIKKANGRRSKADNPFAYLQSMAESTIMQGNRNRFVKNRFLTFVLNHPSDAYSISDLWLQYDDVAGEWKPLLPTLNESDTPEEVERKLAEFNDKLMQLAEEEPEKYKRGREADNIPYRVVNNSDLHQHQVIVKRRGKNVVITINGNPRAAQALNGLTNPDNNDMRGSIGSIISLVGDVNRTLSALYTTLQPDFIVSNFLRDLIYSNSMAFIKEGADYWRRFALNYFVNAWSLKGLFAKYRKGTLDTNNRVEAMFKQFLDNGGETGYRRMLDVEEHKKEIEKALKTLNKKMPFEEWRKHFANWLDEIGRSVETKARFAAFMTSRSLGRDIGRSIFDAKEISVNFNKKGAGDRFLKSQGQTLLGKSGAFVSGAGRTLFIFWNAAIQGTFGNFAKALSQHPGRSLSVASALFVLGMFIQKLVSDGDDGDDDKRGSYYDLPETIRRNNFVFPGPGKSWIKVPLPIEYQAIYGMGELLGGKMFHNEPLSVAEFASQISKLTPIDIMEGQTNNKDGLDLLAPFTPSAIKPMLEVQKNRSWYGLPIYKDTPFNKNMPEWTKAYKNTNTKIVDLCAYLNEMSGGTSYEKGKVDLNPAEIEYLLRSYGGGFWTLPNQLVKLYEAGLGEDFDWRNVPLVNRFVTNGDERTKNRALNNEFFRLEEEYKETMRLIKAYEKDKAQGDKKAVKRLQEIKKSKEYAHLAAFDDKNLYSKIKKSKKMLKEATTEEEEDKLKKELNEIKKQVVKKVRLIDAL